MAIDLHCHSLYSDGTDTPTQIVQQAKAIGLKVVALTDHDTTAGLTEFTQAGIREGVVTIPGVELSCEYKGKDIHVLGYGIRSGAAELEEKLKEIRQDRETRNDRMLQRLADLGYPITFQEVSSLAKGGIVSRIHFALALRDKGYVNSKEEAFERLIGEGCAGYIPRKALTMEEGVTWLNQMGAKVVLAHPMQYKYLGLSGVEELLSKMKALGTVGVEVLHSGCQEENSRLLMDMADRLGLGYTGGSDYHGHNKTAVYLGQVYGGYTIPDIFLKTIGMEECI